MVEWAQMKQVAGVALGTLVVVGWIVVVGGGDKGLSVRWGWVAVQEGTSSGMLVVNPVLRLPRLSQSVFAPVPPCQVVTSCVD